MANWIKTYRGKRYDEFHDCINSIWACDCSECGFHTGQQGINFKYCPSCGSRMENVTRDDVVPMEDIDKLIEVINKVITEEREVDPKWALGLKYSLGLIKQYLKGEKNE